MKQTELAERMGVSVATISRWLNGKQRPGNLDIAERLEVETGVSFRIWLGGSPEEIRKALGESQAQSGS